jgi:hypothetical protein
MHGGHFVACSHVVYCFACSTLVHVHCSHHTHHTRHTRVGVLLCQLLMLFCCHCCWLLPLLLLLLSQLPDGNEIQVGVDRFKVPELLFQPVSTALTPIKHTPLHFHLYLHEQTLGSWDHKYQRGSTACAQTQIYTNTNRHINLSPSQG